MNTTVESPSTPLVVPPTATHTLSTLATRSVAELEQLYRGAPVATTMHAADGALRGRMLAVRALPDFLAAPIRAFTASPSFPWEGKTFAATSATCGHGHNRVFVAGALGRQNLFPFTTRFGASAIDGRPTLILDYDLDVNPGYIRRIHDEIRELSPGLFLGPAMWKTAQGKELVPLFCVGCSAVMTHALVTGASGAIGAALARALRKSWPAVRLALVDREPAPMTALAAELGNATVHVVDLTDLDALPPLVQTVTVDGALDGLINCAGIMEVRPLASSDWATAERLLRVDLLAPLRLQDLVVRGMVERRRGFIVNVASMAGRVPLKGCTYYGAAKAGLAMASEIARAELSPHGVRVVTVYPGPVHSALEAGARAAFGGALLSRMAPTGQPAELATRIVRALVDDEPRVVYPRLYGVGWSAPNLSSWVALAYGPPPA